MEMKIKSQVQFNDDLSQRSNIVSGDSLSNSFAKIHHDLNDYEVAANIAANDRPKNLLYIYDILSDSVSDATEEILGYPIEAGTYVYSAEIYTVQNPSAANVTKIEFLGSDGNTVVGTCNIACNTKKEEHTEITLSDEAYYIKYYRDTYSSGTVGYLKTSKQMICLPNVYAAFPDYTMYAPSLGETFLEVEDSVKTYDVQDTYDSSSYKAISGKGVYSALESLSVSSTGGAGKYISTISETNGKIDPTSETFDTTLSSSGTNSNAPTTKAVYDDQQRQDALEAEDRAALIEQVDDGSKNRLKLRYPFTTTVNGVTFTVQSDQTVLVTGTATDTAITTISAEPYTARQGDILVSGLSAANANAYVYVRGGSTSTNASTAKAFASSDTGVSRNIAIAIFPAAGSVSMTFKPMICTSADWAISQKFVPHAMSNAELTAEVSNITPTIIKDQSTSVGTSYTLISSLTQTTTAGKLCKISAIIAYRNYRPRGIVLSYSNDSSNFDTGDKLIAKTENTGDTYELSASAIISRNNVPVYVWAKAATAGAERIYSIMEQLGDL